MCKGYICNTVRISAHGVYNLTDNRGKATIPDMTKDVFIVIPINFQADFTTYKKAYLPKSQSDDTEDCLVGYNRLTQPSAGKVSVSYKKRAKEAFKASGNWRDDSSSSSKSSSDDNIDENNRIKDCYTAYS